MFDVANVNLQKEEPCIPTLLQTLELQMKKLLAFCTPDSVIQMMEEVESGCQPSLFKSCEHQLPDEELSIGYDTQAFIRSQATLPLSDFYRDVRQYFTAAVNYMLCKFPYGDELL